MARKMAKNIKRFDSHPKTAWPFLMREKLPPGAYEKNIAFIFPIRFTILKHCQATDMNSHLNRLTDTRTLYTVLRKYLYHIF